MTVFFIPVIARSYFVNNSLKLIALWGYSMRTDAVYAMICGAVINLLEESSIRQRSRSSSIRPAPVNGFSRQRYLLSVLVCMWSFTVVLPVRHRKGTVKHTWSRWERCVRQAQ